MQKIKPYLLPFLIFLFSFILRLSLISKGPYHIDSLNLVMQSQKTLQTHQLQPLFGFGYPLTVILGSLFIKISEIFTFHNPVLAINFMSIVFSSFCPPLLYIITKNLFNSRTAFFSTTLFSLSPIFLGISIYGKSHSPCLFFLLSAIIYLL